MSSYVSWGAADWDTQNPSGRVYSTTSATPTEEFVETTGWYTTYYAYQGAASASSQTFGLTSPTGSSTMTMYAVEITDVPAFATVSQTKGSAWDVYSQQVTLAGSGTLAYSTGNPAPGYPSPVAAGDLLVLVVGSKPGTASVTTPAGWTLLGSIAGGSGTTGVDTGPTRLDVFTKEATGSESGTLTVTCPGNSVSWAQIHVFTGGDPSNEWDTALATGVDTSGGSAYSVTTGTAPGLTAFDAALAAVVIPTDVTTPNQFSAEALSSTGATFGTVTEVSEPDSSAGNDIGGVQFWAPVTAGTSTSAVTLSATAGGTTTNVQGPAALIRVRSAAPTTSVTGTQTTAWNVAAQVTGTRAASWDVLATVTGTRATGWDVLITAGPATKATGWHVNAAVTATRAASWNVAAQVTGTAASAWHVLSTVAPSTKASSWDVNEPVAATRAASWDVLAQVTGTASTGWLVAAVVAAQTDSAWNVLAPVTGTQGRRVGRPDDGHRHC